MSVHEALRPLALRSTPMRMYTAATQGLLLVYTIAESQWSKQDSTRSVSRRAAGRMFPMEFWRDTGHGRQVCAGIV